MGNEYGERAQNWKGSARRGGLCAGKFVIKCGFGFIHRREHSRLQALAPTDKRGKEWKHATLCRLQKQLVRYQGDELAVGRFFVRRIDLDAEHVVDVFDFAAIPRHLYRVPDGALHF